MKKQNGKFATCNKCDKEVLCPSGSIIIMRSHLKSIHLDLFHELTKKELKASKAEKRMNLKKLLRTLVPRVHPVLRGFSEQEPKHKLDWEP